MSYSLVFLIVFWLFRKKKGVKGGPGKCVISPPGTNPPPCSKTKHCPWDGHYIWIHDIHTSVVMWVRGVNDSYKHCYKPLSYSSPCAINSFIHCSCFTREKTHLLLFISWNVLEICIKKKMNFCDFLSQNFLTFEEKKFTNSFSL